jgi:hypothetical protein
MRGIAIDGDTVPNHTRVRIGTRTQDTPTLHTSVAGYVRQQTDAKDPSVYASFSLGKCGFIPSPRS